MNQEDTPQKPIIVILGMHRSGTSLVTRSLQVLNVDLGDHLIPAISGDNEKGFWEDIDINDFDNALLEKLGSAWDRLAPLNEKLQSSKLDEERKTAVSMLASKIKSTAVFGFKDPRTAILLPFWKSVFHQLDLDDRYVIAIRSPLNVAKSLHERNGLPLEAGILLWAKHMCSVLRQTQGRNRVVIDYDLMLASPSLQIQRIANKLSLSFDWEDDTEGSEERLRSFENEFVSRDLRHQTSSLKDLKSSDLVPEFVKQAYEWMMHLAKDEIEFDNAGLEKFWKRFEEIFSSFDSGYQYIDRLTLSLHQFENDNRSLSEKLSQKEQGYLAIVNERDSLAKEIEVVRQQLNKISVELAASTEQVQHVSRELEKSRSSYHETQGLLNTVRGKLKKSEKLHVKTTSDLKEARERQSEYQAMYKNAISERDNREQSYQSLHGYFKQSVAERDKVQAANQKYASENAQLHAQLEAVHKSYAWRLTSGSRAVHFYLVVRPVKIIKQYVVKVLNAIWDRLPISPAEKSRLKKRLFKNLPFIFRHFKSYREWQENNASRLTVTSSDSQLSREDQNDFPGGETEVYVPLKDEGVLTQLPVKLIAFYLPQFHEIPENNEWWGEGFTEWTNVKPAEPQFEGHYQPHVPGELGYYDLTDTSVQKRQIELAKQFGIGGFCFYFYWFSGKRLLETPILNYLNDSSLDLPFCLCWANENWSRRWDGLENDILIGQQHSAEDDFAFIEYVSRYLRDPRNMQINGRPLLLVYRPSLLPSPIETAQRWRTWCRENDIGEIYLAYTQSFEAEDPEKYGFDAAIEFPPNNSGPPEITEQVDQLGPDFTGIIYDWRIFVERSKNYQQQDYTLFRSVTPSWDNTARRKTDGAIFANSSPAGYQVWLTRAIEDTLVNRENTDERLVFINAWNEWAEGAYLEPDEKYGYAYLESTRAALEHVVAENNARRILLVIHDAHPHGAQFLILNMAKVLHESMGFSVDMIVLGEGPLLEEYRQYATVHELAGYDLQGEKAVNLIQQLRKQGISSAITNTTVTGLIVPVLKQNNFTVVSLIHELPALIKDYQLQKHAKVIASEADKIVFAATAVKNGFETFTKLDEKKVVMRPQGLYKKNSRQTNEQIMASNQELRHRFNLPEGSKIILGVGFADYRKGIDIFVESGINVLNKNKNVYFVWLGNFEPEIEDKNKKTINKSGFNDYFIFPGLDCDSDIYYAGADVYALTSREDPFPSVVLEALDARTPVVAFSKSGGASELLSRGGGVLVDEMNANAFSEVLVELIDDSDKTYQLGCEGKKIIDEEFSFRKYLFDLTSLANTGLQRVAVVVPNYNYQQYIEERLQTIFSQNYPIYEVIILDDASSDNSVGVIKEFIQEQVIDCKLIVNADNSGNVFKQWAKGVEVAGGDYLWIAEADDLSDVEFLEEVMKGFDGSSTVMSYCESKQMSAEGNILCDNYLAYVSDISKEKWSRSYIENGVIEITTSLAIKNTIPNVSAVVFKREAISTVLKENIDDIKQFKNAGDWVTYIYILMHGDIAYAKHSLNLHRRHESSVTISGFNIGQLEEILTVQKKVKELYTVDESVVNKAKDYSQVLYEQFGLVTKNEPSFDKNHVLKSCL
jgi:glycosyltransferase involved in cell wall biosynthesis